MPSAPTSRATAGNDLADQVGTPFIHGDAAELRRRLGDLATVTTGEHLQARYAMKANSNWKVLEAVRAAGLWISDAVQHGNEVLRARGAPASGWATPPVVDADGHDVPCDNALTVVAGARRSAERRICGHDR